MAFPVLVPLLAVAAGVMAMRRRSSSNAPHGAPAPHGAVHGVQFMDGVQIMGARRPPPRGAPPRPGGTPRVPPRDTAKERAAAQRRGSARTAKVSARALARRAKDAARRGNKTQAKALAKQARTAAQQARQHANALHSMARTSPRMMPPRRPPVRPGMHGDDSDDTTAIDWSGLDLTQIAPIEFGIYSATPMVASLQIVPGADDLGAVQVNWTNKGPTRVHWTPVYVAQTAMLGDSDASDAEAAANDAAQDAGDDDSSSYDQGQGLPPSPGPSDYAPQYAPPDFGPSDYAPPDFDDSGSDDDFPVMGCEGSPGRFTVYLPDRGR